jgi:AraC family transcriptional regulator
MFYKNIPKEYSERINAVVNFILKNSNDELTLSKLAGIANYSPFHFQKIFTQVTGESPKRFVIRFRLENSAHYLIAHRHKTVSEIALDSGFASVSTFSRAFKNYFGISAAGLRDLPHRNYNALRQSINANRNTNFFVNKHDAQNRRKNLKITVNKIPSFQVAFMNAPFSNTIKIQDNYKKIIQLGDAHGIYASNTKFIGVINPHAWLYQTAISFSSHQLPFKDMSTMEIEGGKFAVCKIKGDTQEIFHAFDAFYENWLPKSAYRIKGHFAFEILLQNPLRKSYTKIERELYIPIELA